MKKYLPLAIVAVSLAACTNSQLEYAVQNWDESNLKGNVEEVISVTYWAHSETDCEPVKCSNAHEVSYWHFDENGLCTKSIVWEIPYENCKESSYVVWNVDSKPLEYIRWGMDRLSRKTTHVKYTYNFDGVLTDTNDEMYDWVLNRHSKAVMASEMVNDLTGYDFVVSLGDTIGAVKFSTANGVTDFIHIAHLDGNRYELKYIVKCVESIVTDFSEGKETIARWNNGSVRTTEYDGLLVTKVQQKNKDDVAVTDFENGFAKVTNVYDSGNNLISTTEFSYSGNIRDNGSYRATTKEQNGKSYSIEYFFENGREVKEIVRDDSIVTATISYNDNGDIVTVDSGRDYKEYRKYEYDEKGNWVVCRTFGTDNKPITVVERIIKYRDAK